MVSQPVHRKAFVWRKYSILTSHHFQERSASTHWSEIGTQPGGPSSTSSKSLDVCSLFPSQSQVWMKRRVETSWIITSHSARWPQYRQKFMQGLMHSKRRSLSSERNKNMHNRKSIRINLNLTAKLQLAASNPKDKSFSQCYRKKIKMMGGSDRELPKKRAVQVAETPDRSLSLVLISFQGFHVKRR